MFKGKKYTKYVVVSINLSILQWSQMMVFFERPYKSGKRSWCHAFSLSTKGVMKIDNMVCFRAFT